MPDSLSEAIHNFELKFSREVQKEKNFWHWGVKSEVSSLSCFRKYSRHVEQYLHWYWFSSNWPMADTNNHKNIRLYMQLRILLLHKIYWMEPISPVFEEPSQRNGFFHRWLLQKWCRAWSILKSRACLSGIFRWADSGLIWVDFIAVFLNILKMIWTDS